MTSNIPEKSRQRENSKKGRFVILLNLLNKENSWYLRETKHKMWEDN